MIVKRNSRIMVAIFISMLLTGCIIGPGGGDYNISLINDYEVVRLSSHNIIIGKLDGIIEGSSWKNIIPPKVLKVGYDSQYISVLIQPVDASVIHFVEDDSTQEYYIIDTLTQEVKGPLSKQAYLDESIVSHIELKSLDSYDKQY